MESAGPTRVRRRWLWIISLALAATVAGWLVFLRLTWETRELAAMKRLLRLHSSWSGWRHVAEDDPETRRANRPFGRREELGCPGPVRGLLVGYCFLSAPVRDPVRECRLYAVPYWYGVTGKRTLHIAHDSPLAAADLGGRPPEGLGAVDEGAAAAIDPEPTGRAGLDPGALVRSESRFSIALLRAAGAREPGNLVLATYGTFASMVAAWRGARGETRSELEAALSLPAELGDLDASAAALRERLRVAARLSRSELDLDLLLRLPAGVDLEPSFRPAVETSHGVRLEVSHERVELVSAGRFRGEWKERFKPEETRPAPFTLLDGEKVDVPFMRRVGSFRTLQADDGLRLASLAYGDGSLELLLLLPPAGGLEQLEKSLTAERLDDLGRRLQPPPLNGVTVGLPRFALASPLDLVPAFRALGVARAFTPGEADFSGISRQPLHIATLEQELSLEVDEHGTKVDWEVVTGFQDDAPVDVIADRPFLFFIRETATGIIVIAGRVVDPRPDPATRH